MFRITHPRSQAGRQKALGVEFIDGFAEVDELHPERRQALIQHGYSIEPVEPKLKPAKARKPKGKVEEFAVAETAGEAYMPLTPNSARNAAILDEARQRLENPET